MNHRGLSAWLLLAALAVAPCLLAAPQELAVIQLRHRLPEELIPLIQPLLSPADAAIPNRNQLIIKASPATIAEIRTLLDQIDQRPHRLLITVLQGSESSGEGTGMGFQGRIDLGHPGGVDVRGGAYSTEGRDTRGTTQRVQTLDGHAAQIQVGAEIPVPSPYGLGYQYRTATTGFSVTPRLSGSRVLIDIEPWSDRFDRGTGGVIATQSARTTISAGLGEWMEIGGQVETSVGQRSGLAGQDSFASGRENRILLKVEDLDAGSP